MLYTEIFSAVKIKNFVRKKKSYFAQNIDCEYTLEPPRRGSTYVFPQSMFWVRNKTNRYIPANPSFTI